MIQGTTSDRQAQGLGRGVVGHQDEGGTGRKQAAWEVRPARCLRFV